MQPINANGLALLRHAEGTLLCVYLDARGFETCGTGHLVRKADNLHLGDKITDAQADAFLQHDLAEALTCVDRNCPNLPSQNARAALASFVFNIGCGAFGDSTLLRLVRVGNFLGAAEEFKNWTRAGNTHPPGLVSRRAAERALFLTPDDVAMPEGWLRADHAARIRTASESQHAVPAAGQAA